MSRRFRTRPTRTVLILLVLAALALFRVWQDARRPAAPPPLDEGVYRVARVVDGDTLLLDDDRRVRLIGVDAPESVKPDHPVEPLGPEATDFTRRFVSAGEVRLQFDRERIDQYGRTLAYVWVGDRLLNEELLRAGLARFEPRYDYSQAMKTRFRRAADEARETRRGLFAAGAN